MAWPELFPAVTGLLYVGASVAYGHAGQPGLALAYAAYAAANVGLIWAAIEGR